MRVERVSYTGPEAGGLSLGDQGRVLSTSDSTVHVMWSSGALSGQVVPVYDFDLVPMSRTAALSDGLEDSLDVGGLMAFSARQVFDSGGEVAVLNEMVDAGHLQAFADIAEEAVLMLAARIRHDPSFVAVAAELDEDEAEAVLRLASVCLIRDAFTEDL